MCGHCRNVAVENASEPDKHEFDKAGSVDCTSQENPDFSKSAADYGVRLCLLLLKGYQYCISPLFPPCCRYTPTCSEYAVEAVTRYGAVRGIWLAICRILRCHPFVRGGYDPVK